MTKLHTLFPTPTPVPEKDENEQLLREYTQGLLAAGYGMTRRALKQLDRIDVRPILTDNDPNAPDLGGHIPLGSLRSGLNGVSDILYVKEEYHHLLEETPTNAIFAIVPCFKEGVLQVNKDRYFHWILKDVNPVQQTLTLFLQDYSKIAGMWSPGVSGTVLCQDVPHKQSYALHTERSTQCLYSDLYNMLTKEDLHWTKSQWDQWEHTFLTHAKRTEAQFFSLRQTTNFRELAKLYVSYMRVVNYMLSQHKPKTLRTPTAQTKVIRTQYEDAPQPVVRKRMVGLLPISSVKVPKLPNAELVRTYKLASWKARGHIRTYKSGKQVYIPETVKHRKNLTPTDATPQTILTMKHRKPDSAGGNDHE